MRYGSGSLKIPLDIGAWLQSGGLQRVQTWLCRAREKQFIEGKWSESQSVVSDSLWSHGLYSPWNSPGQNIEVGSHSFLQGICPTQGLNPGLPHCRQIVYQLRHKGSPRILEWVAYPFFSGSSWPRNGTEVSFIAGRFFTNWAIREADSFPDI